MSSKYEPPTPCTKKKRPLTAFNLFYRFKRARILKACAAGKGDKESIRKLISTAPGLENMTDQELRLPHPKDVDAFRRGIIRNEMQDNLLPSDGKRPHRKTQGLMMEFLEMGKAMSDSWKVVDSYSRSIFQELADEGKKFHHERLSENKSESKDLDEEDPLYKMLKENIASPSVSHPISLLPTGTTHSKYTGLVSPSNSPRLVQHKKVNIALTNNGPPIYRPDVEASKVSDDTFEPRDEFCAYIESHIHLVDNVRLDQLVQDDGMPKNFMEMITMDESISHCALPY